MSFMLQQGRYDCRYDCSYFFYMFECYIKCIKCINIRSRDYQTATIEIDRRRQRKIKSYLLSFPPSREWHSHNLNRPQPVFGYLILKSKIAEIQALRENRGTYIQAPRTAADIYKLSEQKYIHVILKMYIRSVFPQSM